MRNLAIGSGALAALVLVGSARAHHVSGVYDLTTPIWLNGIVVRFERVNPHSITIVEGSSADGQVRRWRVEGPGLSQLDQLARGFPALGDAGAPQVGFAVPTPGDRVAFCGFAYKPEYSSPKPPVDSDGSPLRSIEGHVLVLPGGQKQLWDPHGNLSECIRASDEQRQPWLDFLNANTRARDAWCAQRSMESTEKVFVDELNSQLADPCK